MLYPENIESTFHFKRKAPLRKKPLTAVPVKSVRTRMKKKYVFQDVSHVSYWVEEIAEQTAPPAIEITIPSQKVQVTSHPVSQRISELPAQPVPQVTVELSDAPLMEQEIIPSHYDIEETQVSEAAEPLPKYELPEISEEQINSYSAQLQEHPSLKVPSFFSSLFSWTAARELFKFAGVSAVTFVLVLSVMNFSAYTQYANYWLGKWKGETNVQMRNLEALVENKDERIRLLQANNAGIPFLPKAGATLPSVSLDIMPPDNRIVIPKIGKNVPIVDISDANLLKQDWIALEQDIQAGLKNGVVHYPGTAIPGQKGNFFVTGHSSYYFWENSKYKDIFALLPEVEVGDSVTVYYNQKKYTYTITDKKVVQPTNTEVLKQTDDRRITLMTCWPIGTDLNRIILVGSLEP